MSRHGASCSKHWWRATWEPPPSETSARYVVRASSLSELEEIRGKVQRCFEAGAIATGSKMEIVGGTKPYSEMKHDTAIAAIYRRNSEALGRQFPVPGLAARTISASSDMGNVSLALPAIHPTMGIDSLPAVNHQPEFAAHCTTESANNAVVDGSLAMAWTAVDVASDAALRTRLMNHWPHHRF